MLRLKWLDIKYFKIKKQTFQSAYAKIHFQFIFYFIDTQPKIFINLFQVGDRSALHEATVAWSLPPICEPMEASED